MELTCEICGVSAAAEKAGRSESQSWHLTEKGGHICPGCWRARRDDDPTVQAARRLAGDAADDRAEAAQEPPARHRQKP